MALFWNQASFNFSWQFHIVKPFSDFHIEWLSSSSLLLLFFVHYYRSSLLIYFVSSNDISFFLNVTLYPHTHKQWLFAGFYIFVKLFLSFFSKKKMWFSRIIKKNSYFTFLLHWIIIRFFFLHSNKTEKNAVFFISTE